MSVLGPTQLAERSFVWTRRHIAILTVLCVGHVLETVDITITNVALPAIRAGVGFSEADLSWVVNGYTVVFGGFLLLGGRAGDVWGHRRVLGVGLALFSGASALAALAGGPLILVLGRGLQGLAAALIAPMTLALLAAVFPEGRARDTAVGFWAIITTVSGALSMLAGGLLTGTLGWRWVFWVNVGVATLVLVAGLRVLPRDRPGGAGSGHDRSRPARPRLDALGAASATAGIGLLVAALIGSQEAGWTSGRSLVPLAAAGAVLGYAVVHETALTRDPLLPVALLRAPGMLRANLTQALCGGAIFVMFYTATLYQQNVLGYTPLQTAVAYLPHTVVLVVGARLAPWLIARVGPGGTAGAGAVVGATGMVLLAGVPVRGGFADTLLVPTLLLGAAIPLTLIPNTTAALADVPGDLHGAGAGAVNIARVLGGTVGLALASSLAAGRSDALLRGGRPLADALTSGYRTSFGIAAAFFAVAAVVRTVCAGRHEPGPAAEHGHPWSRP